MNKQDLRDKVKERMATISLEQRNSKTREIHKQLFEKEEWKMGKLIGTTISTGNEIDTYTIIKQAWKEGKDIAVPKCIPKEKELTFYKISSFEDLEVSYFHLKEPIPERTVAVKPDDIDLLIVPGIVFDRGGYRIGYGGGYYDRFLQGRELKTCSLCFEFQLVDAVPKEKHDIPVKIIITENGSIG
ncbi:5-formyltetrahydrofolate cyclo-ligase [Evansella vedderi]|uniref:5-formyltetrahydrofolate cyclo-ligase n=1 Tax=Evansella vedderi TaxID=38282 RepID=A0ABT9ZWB2_9BACI|nr:5-formyltetrahydrofolate cyclo-ligase [Evansella vedderi]MDQ0254410.1 5-formyltetrahydrofolate cyclo-ligase [Evansella vedderi]